MTLKFETLLLFYKGARTSPWCLLTLSTYFSNSSRALAAVQVCHRAKTPQHAHGLIYFPPAASVVRRVGVGVGSAVQVGLRTCVRVHAHTRGRDGSFRFGASFYMQLNRLRGKKDRKGAIIQKSRTLNINRQIKVCALVLCRVDLQIKGIT